MAGSRLLVVAGPSGVGKGTVMGLVRGHIAPGKILYSISHTTREPRAGETDGREYFFISRNEFLRMKEEGKFLETAEYSGNLYGTSLAEIQRITQQDGLPFLEIEFDGIKQLQSGKEEGLNTLYVFIYPPTKQDLVERLRGRGTENEDAVKKRLQKAEEELEHMQTLRCDYALVNDDKERCAMELLNFLKQHYPASCFKQQD